MRMLVNEWMNEKQEVEEALLGGKGRKEAKIIIFLSEKYNAIKKPLILAEIWGFSFSLNAV